MSRSSHQAIEEKTLYLTITVAALSAVVGLLFAYISHSIAIFIDAIYTIFAVFIEMFALYSTQKIQQPPDDEFNYGYYKLEPLAMNLECILIFGVAIVAVAMSGYELFAESVATNYLLGIVYAILATITCGTMYRLVLARAKQTHSQILTANAQIWKGDTLMSIGVFVGFIIGYLLQLTKYKHLADYIDPMLTLIIAIVIIQHPLRLLRKGMRDLLDGHPGETIQLRAERVIAQTISEDSPITVQELRITRAGRMLFMDVGYRLPETIHRDLVTTTNANVRTALEKSFSHIEVVFFICEESQQIS